MSKFQTQSPLLAALSILSMFLGYSAMATDLICQTDVSPIENSATMTLPGGPTAPREDVATNYHFTLSITGVGSKTTRLNAALTTTLANGQLSSLPLPSLIPGIGGTTVARSVLPSDGHVETRIQTPPGIVLSLNESEVQKFAADGSEFQIGFNARSFPFPADVSMPASLFLSCVSFK